MPSRFRSDGATAGRLCALTLLLAGAAACGQRGNESQSAPPPQQQAGMDAPVANAARNGPAPSRAYWGVQRGLDIYGSVPPGGAPTTQAVATYEPDTDWYALGLACRAEMRTIELQDFGASGSPRQTELRIPGRSLTLSGSSEHLESDDVVFTATASASDPFWRAFLDHAGQFEVRTQGWGEKAFLWDPALAEVLRSCGV